MVKLTAQSTLLELWPHLTDARRQVAGARQKLMLCKKAYGDARVVIGITGSGQKPCYRILYKSADTNVDSIYGSYWDNSEPLSREDAQNNNWATASNTFDQVDQFLREKIGWKGA